MAKDKVESISNSLQIDKDYAGPISAMSFYFCDTEADLPEPAFGKFAIVKEPSQSGHYFFQVGTDDGWKRTKLNQ